MTDSAVKVGTLDELIRAKARRELAREMDLARQAVPLPWHDSHSELLRDASGTPLTLRAVVRLLFQEIEARHVEQREREAVESFLERHEEFAREIGSLQDQVSDVAANQG